jgi:hypothetical protein
MTAFKRSQAKYVKHAYQTTNWPEYEAALRQRGSLTLWLSGGELKDGMRQHTQSENRADSRDTLTTRSGPPCLSCTWIATPLTTWVRSPG